MKTKSKILITILLLLFVTSSCNYLDENVITNLGKDQVFSTPSGIESVLIGCYVNFGSYNGGYGNTEFEIHSNSLILEAGKGVPAYSIVGTILPTDYHVEAIYLNKYEIINQLNDLIDNTPTSKVNLDVKKKYIAEAKFLRAVCYFDLVRLFGRVPLHTEKTQYIQDGFAPRASMLAIYKQILSDLTDAEDGMPPRELQAPERPNKMAATAYKAKVYLFLACMTNEHFVACKEKQTIDTFKNHFVDSTLTMNATTQLWQKCFDNAKKVKDSGVYELYPQYSKLWNGTTRNTKESILELQFGSVYGTNAASFMATTANSSTSQLNGLVGGNGNAGRNLAGRNTFIENWKKYGNGKYLLPKTGDLTPVMSSDREIGCDPRINANYVYYWNPEYINGDRTQPTLTSMFPQANFNNNAALSKWMFLRKYQNTNLGNGDVNLILYRYAEVLLILAEAANELDDKATVKECIELILSRARSENTLPVSVGSDPRIFGKIQPVSWDYDSMTKDQMRTSIMQEREFELPGECQDFYDVRRRGIEYLKYRMEIASKWYRRIALANNTIDPNLPDVWEGWGKPTGANTVEADYLVAGYETPEFLTRALFVPIPAKELRLNIALTSDDQNYGY